MEEWKLPSQLVTTDRKENETVEQMQLRHEQMRRITAESDLIKCLDFIKERPSPSAPKFLARFLDKTINN